MMKKITATVVYPVYVQIEIQENASIEEVEELILDEAERLFNTSTVEPLIQDHDYNCEEDD